VDKSAGRGKIEVQQLLIKIKRLIITKGTIKKDNQGQEAYYLLISSKHSTFD
jgi:hypothetical protein